MNILEKALAKLHGTYRALDAGSSSSTTPSPEDAAKTSSAAVMAMLSGGVATREHVKDREINGPALFATAQRLMDNGGGGMSGHEKPAQVDQWGTRAVRDQTRD